ncbi:MAG: leucine-rich repeat protein [Ruminococcus callidus]
MRISNLPQKIPTVKRRSCQCCYKCYPADCQAQRGQNSAGAYKDGKRLKEVTLEEGITLIEDDAFANCDNLEKIVIPKSVTGIHYMAFTYDTKLTMYGYKDTYAERYAEMFGFPLWLWMTLTRHR